MSLQYGLCLKFGWEASVAFGDELLTLSGLGEAYEKLEVLEFVHNILWKLSLAHCSSGHHDPTGARKRRITPSFGTGAELPKLPALPHSIPAAQPMETQPCCRDQPDLAVRSQGQEFGSERQILGTRTGKEGDFQVEGKGELLRRQREAWTLRNYQNVHMCSHGL